MSTRSKVLKFLRQIESGKITRSFAEQYLEEEGDLETLETLQEIWDHPEMGDIQ